MLFISLVSLLSVSLLAAPIPDLGDWVVGGAVVGTGVIACRYASATCKTAMSQSYDDVLTKFKPKQVKDVLTPGAQPKPFVPAPEWFSPSNPANARAATSAQAFKNPIGSKSTEARVFVMPAPRQAAPFRGGTTGFKPVFGESVAGAPRQANLPWQLPGGAKPVSHSL